MQITGNSFHLIKQKLHTNKASDKLISLLTLLLSMEQFQTKKGFLKHQVHEISWKNVYMQYLRITTIYRLAEKEALHLTS